MSAGKIATSNVTVDHGDEDRNPSRVKPRNEFTLLGNYPCDSDGED